MIYLASPYTHPDPAVMEQRFEQTCLVAGRMMKKGLIVFSPVIHCHPISIRVSLPTDWKFWEQYDTVMLFKADEFDILRLPGWSESKGVLAEWSLANARRLPITFIDL